MNSPIPHRADHLPLLDRDESILRFNLRVLDWARRTDVPLLERLRYLCIVSSNLDEFFEVRAELHLSATRQGKHAGPYGLDSHSRISERAHALVDEQYQLYNEALLPAFAKSGIHILSHNERNQVQQNWVKSYFQSQVKPLLTPVGLDPSHPFPQVANKSLNFIVRLSGKDAFGRENEIAIVKVPRVLPRVIRMPDKLAGKRSLFVTLSSVIRSHLSDLFPGREVGQFSQFRVTRHSDLALDSEDVRPIHTYLRQGLLTRTYGASFPYSVSAGCSAWLADFWSQ